MTGASIHNSTHTMDVIMHKHTIRSVHLNTGAIDININHIIKKHSAIILFIDKK